MFGYVNATISEPEHPAFGKHFETSDGKSFVFFSAQLAAADLLEHIENPPAETPEPISAQLSIWKERVKEMRLEFATLEYLEEGACFAKILETEDRDFIHGDDGYECEKVQYDLDSLCELCEDALSFIADLVQDEAQRQTQQPTFYDRIDTLRKEAIASILDQFKQGKTLVKSEQAYIQNGDSGWDWVGKISAEGEATEQNLSFHTYDTIGDDPDEEYVGKDVWSHINDISTDCLCAVADNLYA